MPFSKGLPTVQCKVIFGLINNISEVAPQSGSQWLTLAHSDNRLWETFTVYSRSTECKLGTEFFSVFFSSLSTLSECWPLLFSISGLAHNKHTSNVQHRKPLTEHNTKQKPGDSEEF